MIKRFFLFFLWICLCANSAYARITNLRSFGPLRTRSQNPLSLQFLSLPFERALTLNKHQFATDISTTFSNVFEYNPTRTTRINFDMEIWRTALTLQYGFMKNLDVMIELPFLTNSGGFLDSFVQGYHNAFGFPNAGRDLVPNGQYRFNLSQGRTSLFDYSNTPFGLGDLTLRAKWLVTESIGKFPLRIALTPSLKLPTGKITQGLSSGRADVGFGVLAEKNLKRFHFVTQAGLVILGGHEDIGQLMRPVFFQFGQSVEFQITTGLAAVAQLTGNTSPFHGIDVPELTEPTVDLNLGITGAKILHHPFLDEFYYQVSFGEDITSKGPSVDFALMFLAGLRY